MKIIDKNKYKRNKLKIKKQIKTKIQIKTII